MIIWHSNQYGFKDLWFTSSLQDTNKLAHFYWFPDNIIALLDQFI